LTGCKSEDDVDRDDDANEDTDTYPCSGVITFPDANLEVLIRQKIHKSTGDIVYEDVQGVTSLDAYVKEISDLTGIQCLKNLTVLDLTANRISDFRPLSALTRLTELHLDGNQITDLGPLSTMTSLISLQLGGNQISDINPLSTMTGLRGLSLYNNQISDVSALVENSGLDEDSHVDITTNPLNCDDEATMADLQTLLNRGVDLHDDCNQSMAQ
jgi:Leucine-rich repeat (LRR) protein